MRATLNIPDDLIFKVQELSGEKNKTSEKSISSLDSSFLIACSLKPIRSSTLNTLMVIDSLKILLSSDLSSILKEGVLKA